MKTKLSLNILFLLLCITSNAQKELWGVNTGSENNVNDPAAYLGNITKYDINGENPVIMHEFDLTHGAIPKGRLLLASNGKLYGTTVEGGNFFFNGAQNVYAGVLFEYDLIFDKFRVVHYFDYSSNPVATNPDIGVIEPIQGILVGATNNRMYKYNIADESIAFSNALPFSNSIHGELIKASNGFVYGTSYAGNCQSTSSPEPYLGNIVRYNMTTNNLSFAHSINCNEQLIKGSTPTTQLIELSPGKVYGTCRNGGSNMFANPFLRGGTLFEFNVNTNVFTKKVDFEYASKGLSPLNLVDNGDGKIYGISEEGGVQSTCSLTGEYGTLYEYDTVLNTYEIKQYFNDCISNDFTIRYPKFLAKTSLGHFIGCDFYGNIFKYVLNTNTITRPSFGYNVANLIEICRKPSYREFTPDTFAPATGSAFTYDIQNTNATTYVWKKGNVVLPAQNTAVLNLPNVTQADNGVYTCTMTNECGTTVTMNLFINVDNLSVSFDDYFKNKIELYPNPTQNNLNIELPKNIDVTIKTIKIANSLGQLVREQNSTNTTIDVSQLQTGMYYISLTTNYGNWNGKFVKD